MSSANSTNANSTNEVVGQEASLEFGRVLLKSVFTYIAGSHEAKMNLSEHVREVLYVMTTEDVKDGQGFKGDLQRKMTQFSSHRQMQESELALITDELNEIGADALAKERELEDFMTRYEEMTREKKRLENDAVIAKQKAEIFAEQQDAKIEDIARNEKNIEQIQAKSHVHRVYSGGLEEVDGINLFGAHLPPQEIHALLENGAGSENSLWESFQNLTNVGLIQIRRFIKNAGVESHPAHKGKLKIIICPRRAGSNRDGVQSTLDLAWETYDTYLPQAESSANVDAAANEHSMPPINRTTRKRKTDFDSIAAERFNIDVVEEFASPMRMDRIRLGKESAKRRRLFPPSPVSLGVSKRTGALDVPSTPTFASRTKTAASSTTPVPDDNANNVNDESSGKHCLMGGGIEPPYNKGFMQRLNPIAEKGDDMLDELGSPMIDNLD